MEDYVPTFSDPEFPKKLGITVPCLICGDQVLMERIGDCPKICEKCKKAVLKVRKEMGE